MCNAFDCFTCYICFWRNAGIVRKYLKLWLCSIQEMLLYIACERFLCLQSSATYWEGKADAESLQRIYGISFPDPKQLKEWKHFQEEAAKRDHRKIGKVSHSSQYNCKITLSFSVPWDRLKVFKSFLKLRKRL